MLQELFEKSEGSFLLTCAIVYMYTTLRVSHSIFVDCQLSFGGLSLKTAVDRIFQNESRQSLSGSAEEQAVFYGFPHISFLLSCFFTHLLKDSMLSRQAKVQSPPQIPRGSVLIWMYV